jgi:Uma2 family endonuclease
MPHRGIQIDGPLLQLRVPPAAFEHAGFRKWVTAPSFPEKANVSFVDGEVFVDMSPESLEAHNKVKTALTSDLVQLMRRGDPGEVYGDRMLLTHRGARFTTEPDVCFASWATLDSGRLSLRSRKRRHDEYIELVGAPDVVVEIVSDSSERKDLKRLRTAYERAGIPEYWIIDAREDRIRFQILRLGRRGYRESAPVGRPQPSKIFGRIFRLLRRRNHGGRWTYLLKSAPIRRGRSGGRP